MEIYFQMMGAMEIADGGAEMIVWSAALIEGLAYPVLLGFFHNYTTVGIFAAITFRLAVHSMSKSATMEILSV